MITYCNMCIASDPHNPKYYLKRGLAHAYHQNNLRAALADLEMAHELDEKDPVILNELNKVRTKLEVGDEEELKEPEAL